MGSCIASWWWIWQSVWIASTNEEKHSEAIKVQTINMVKMSILAHPNVFFRDLSCCWRDFFFLMSSESWIFTTISFELLLSLSDCDVEFESSLLVASEVDDDVGDVTFWSPCWKNVKNIWKKIKPENFYYWGRKGSALFNLSN